MGVRPATEGVTKVQAAFYFLQLTKVIQSETDRPLSRAETAAIVIDTMGDA
jgi:hypothetical protein